MYWVTKDRQILEIKDMTDSHLQNCKRMLERQDLRIETLKHSSARYAIFTSVNRHEFDDSFEIHYNYTSSNEYYNISLELKRRGL